ncbi:hypothetical protein G6M70_06120 [Agrobacterium tumefaciens]|uniref:hypothetical protein n=1 Tax=Agrobacterium tumefaciens TaxID=358 RepID=UPI0015716C66|nr:hypothetical protein [Agrobacterium tumefaciens]NSZ00644.1 hypothetical protein [Agrobacterium tumefaciens]NSZ38138.1 hypothetical protein [Agrobacterium tumefaciens]NTB25615.1 hypothetical protein [Agrobacterium tumefaciens]NTB27042.1 hypothetical protein [Agrobacterium tumefaciens]NTB32332.1 hypothetical protein [Agrobacterium tumefaciens]
MPITRRLFVVPLANNNHGKTSIVRSLVSQGEGKHYVSPHPQKSFRKLVSFSGRIVDAYVFCRSYQETEKSYYGSVLAALDGNDPQWRLRELIIMPSHVTNACPPDTLEMIDAGHSAGFDMISASVILQKGAATRLNGYQNIWMQNWDERWTIQNPYSTSPAGQLDALGRDLWTRVARTITP